MEGIFSCPQTEKGVEAGDDDVVSDDAEQSYYELIIFIWSTIFAILSHVAAV